jgi:type VI protein secretion system component VasK
VFVYLGLNAQAPPLAMNAAWLWTLGAVLVVSAAVCGWRLWTVTRFS